MSISVFKLWVAGLALAGAVMLPGRAAAVDRMALSAGPSTDANEVRVALDWDWNKRLYTEGNWHLTGYWELSAGYWLGDGEGGHPVFGVGAVPVFRFAPNDPAYSNWRWDVGVGVHVLSEDRPNNHRHLGTHVLFSDVLGVSRVFGAGGQYELGYRFWHLSNADLARENDGISFHEIRFAWRF